MAVLGVSNKGTELRADHPAQRRWRAGFDARQDPRHQGGRRPGSTASRACQASQRCPSRPTCLSSPPRPGSSPHLIDECIDSGKVRSAIVIPGGVGETQDSHDIAWSIRDSLARAREQGRRHRCCWGPNSLGVQSRPGRYDTFFIPDNKLDKRRGAGAGRGVACMSQSGAFIISRMSNFDTLDPQFTVSIGNQGST
jgi:hypothetical protein